MSTSTAVPVTVTPEAAARVAELGIGTAVERMVEHARQAVPGLKAIDVILEPAWDTGPDDYLTIQAFSDRDWDPEDKAWEAWCRWKGEAFSPDVGRHITMTILHRAEHER